MSLLPPIAVEGSWRTVDEDENLLFVVYPFRVLFRTWKRILDGLLRGGLVLPVGPLVARVNSIGLFGGRFSCPGFCGFVPLVQEAADGLALHSFLRLRVSVISGSPALIRVFFFGYLARRIPACLVTGLTHRR